MILYKTYYLDGKEKKAILSKDINTKKIFFKTDFEQSVFPICHFDNYSHIVTFLDNYYGDGSHFYIGNNEVGYIFNNEREFIYFATIKE